MYIFDVTFTVNYTGFMNSSITSFSLKQDERKHMALSHPIREIQIETNSGKLTLCFAPLSLEGFELAWSTLALHCITYVFPLVFSSTIKRESFIRIIIIKSQHLTSEAGGKQEGQKQS